MHRHEICWIIGTAIVVFAVISLAAYLISTTRIKPHNASYRPNPIPFCQRQKNVSGGP